MSYYVLPRASLTIYHYIDCILKCDHDIPVISNTLANYLYAIKEKIDDCERDWDIFKKYTNPYEYIHTMVPYKKNCVAKYKPLSRSYYKMIEIIHTFNILPDQPAINTFHLAEGPGGFIEAVANIRKQSNDKYTGITLMADMNDPNIPGWKKTNNFLRANPNVEIIYGADGTGDILSLQNMMDCNEKYASSMDLVTADGGFDFSSDFNKQETSISFLLFAQVTYALILQKHGGSFVLKLFDCFMQHTVDILYILSAFYKKVYVSKPQTSRNANSEKYIVCKDFIHHSNCEFLPYFYRAFEKMLMDKPPNLPICVHRFLNMPIPLYFTNKLEEYNAIFGQQQIENIQYTISLIENKHNQEKIDKLIRNNIQKCINWCNKYHIQHHIIM